MECERLQEERVQIVRSHTLCIGTRENRTKLDYLVLLTP